VNGGPSMARGFSAYASSPWEAGFKELINITDMDFAFPNPSLVAVERFSKTAPRLSTDLCAPMPGHSASEK